MMFEKADESLIDQKGIARDEVIKQVERFAIGFDSVQLLKPCTVGDGIVHLSDQSKRIFEEKFTKYTGKISKFVPASGAATRMFEDLFAFLDHTREDPTNVHDIRTFKEGVVFDFFNHIQLFAFYKKLESAFENIYKISLQEALVTRRYVEVLEVLLSEKGLNYSNCPKGLLEFHSYNDSSRTAAMEHIVEAQMHASSTGNSLTHFTVSDGHIDSFKSNLQENVTTSISYSTQNPSTDTVAVDLDNNPFRDNDGKLMFRPSGHGALLENLNAIDSDLIFVKNIDNILPDRYKSKNAKYKKILAGVLLDYQEQAFDLLRRHDNNEDVATEARVLVEELGTVGIENEKELVEKLNRPIRVCGMVKNIGEPGGGPFWVKGSDKVKSIQIVEKNQVGKNENQKRIFGSSTHFNPVDLVCGVRNYRREKFDLMKYRDPESGFISEKTYEGRKLKGMELPGLWNGSMSDWNTVFVEVPLSTFAPVKKVNDLLRPEHQPAGEPVENKPSTADLIKS